MKVYTEVIWQWSDKDKEMIEISSSSHESHGEVALCYCGDYEGSDKLAKADVKQGTAATASMKLTQGQYLKMTGEDNFYDREIKRLTEDTNAQKEEGKENFQLAKKQGRQAFQLQSSQGAQSQQALIAEQTQEMGRTREVASDKAEQVRAQSAEESYGAMSAGGGLAGGGGRRRKTLGKKLAGAMGGMKLELKQTLDRNRERMASGEQQMNQERTSGAVNMQQATDTAEQSMQQQRSGLDRALASETTRLNQEKEQGVDRLRKEAQDLVSLTTGSFLNSYSTWDNRTTGFNGWDVDTYFPLEEDA